MPILLLWVPTAGKGLIYMDLYMHAIGGFGKVIDVIADNNMVAV